jgi:phenylacetate-CoA ligase
MTDYDDFNSVSPVLDAKSIRDRRERNPLITEAGFRNFLRIKHHPNAPVWNFETGDRIETPDLAAHAAFAGALTGIRRPFSPEPPPEILSWVRSMRLNVSAFAERLPADLDTERDWAAIRPVTREDIAARLHTVVPLDADLSRLITYDTSGTTGHAIAVPTHPRVLAQVLAMMTYVMDRYDIPLDVGPEMTACLNVGAQAMSVVFPNIMTVWREAGFAKVNLHPDGWRSPDDVHRFFREMAPPVVTGDPVAFAEMLRLGIDHRPEILFTTALSLPSGLKERLEIHYGCPVVDWYAVSETGPIGYACRESDGFHLLPHDIYVEILDDRDRPLPPGETGDIAVTGGRNPYLPLLRYRTGDRGAMETAPCPCGEPTPRIRLHDGRRPVLFQSESGAPVNPIDIGRLLRGVAFVQYRMVQREDRSCDLTLRPILKDQAIDRVSIERKLKLLFGAAIDIRIHVDPTPGDDLPGGKAAVYENEMVDPDPVRPYH